MERDTFRKVLINIRLAIVQYIMSIQLPSYVSHFHYPHNHHNYNDCKYSSIKVENNQFLTLNKHVYSHVKYVILYKNSNRLWFGVLPPYLPQSLFVFLATLHMHAQQLGYGLTGQEPHLIIFYNYWMNLIYLEIFIKVTMNVILILMDNYCTVPI